MGVADLTDLDEATWTPKGGRVLARVGTGLKGSGGGGGSNFAEEHGGGIGDLEISKPPERRRSECRGLSRGEESRPCSPRC
jgi:hypothetical protein